MSGDRIALLLVGTREGLTLYPETDVPRHVPRTATGYLPEAISGFEVLATNSEQEIMIQLERNKYAGIPAIICFLPDSRGEEVDQMVGIVVRVKSWIKQTLQPVVLLVNTPDGTDEETRNRFVDAGVSLPFTALTVPNFMSFLKAGMNILMQAVDLHRTRFDHLTGLLARKGFREESIRVISNAHSPVSLAYIDVDDFKEINDSFGHSAGDEALKYVARRLRQYFRRKDDVIGRRSGDEFVVLMAHTDEGHAAERIQSFLNALGSPRRGEPGIAATVGVCTHVPNEFEDASLVIDHMIEVADGKLIRLKDEKKVGR